MSAKPIHVRVDSDPVHLEPIRLDCEAFARDLGFEESDIAEIGLCINEAMANVIEHAYRFEKGRPIEVWIDAAEAGQSGGEGGAQGGGNIGIRLRVRDWGSGIDPSKLPIKPKDPLVPGGLGLICMREMMDRVEYAPQASGGMLLTLTRWKSGKRRHQDTPAESDAGGNPGPA